MVFSVYFIEKLLLIFFLAVIVTGFTSEYWIVKNSWGIGWGDNGYIYIKMGNYYNICTRGAAFTGPYKRHHPGPYFGYTISQVYDKYVEEEDWPYFLVV